MIPLTPFVQNYSWGKLGKLSEVAQLLSSNSGTFVHETTPYAELWMGTHPKGPTKISSDNQPLSKWLSHNQDATGNQAASWEKDLNTGDQQLPFLFKVLSVNEALSIQVHPNKDQAKILHAIDPNNYPDANHKPEMAIALTPFEMMCSFRLASEISKNINENPELASLIRPSSVELLQVKSKSGTDFETKAALKACFSDLMKQDTRAVESALKLLSERYNRFKLHNNNLVELFLRIHGRFPTDVGCFAIFFMNYLKLQPGEAVFLGPNEPHAYLFGDCIECMACSDNTIRAGLTPKFKDVNNLLEMLTYSMKRADEVRFSPQHDGKFLTIYRPPVPEFVVHKIEISTVEVYKLAKLETCSILICIRGKAEAFNGGALSTVSRGSIFLIAANLEYDLNIVENPFLVFRAFCDS